MYMVELRMTLKKFFSLNKSVIGIVIHLKLKPCCFDIYQTGTWETLESKLNSIQFSIVNSTDKTKLI